MRRGVIILCGGKSTRMGRDKAWLPFGPAEVLLQRVVRIASSVVSPERMVVVAAHDQKLPTLPAGVRRGADRRPEQGPLEGLAVGLAALAEEADAAFVTSCDVPLLQPPFIAHCLELLAGGNGDHEIVVPVDEHFAHPLAAAYRTCVVGRVESLLEEDRRRPIFLFEKCRTLKVPVDQFRKVDPELRSLANCNRPQDYHAALRVAGFGPDPTA